jgi:hypothetical protein
MLGKPGSMPGAAPIAIITPPGGPLSGLHVHYFGHHFVRDQPFRGLDPVGTAKAGRSGRPEGRDCPPEFHARLAEAGNEFYRQVNGNYLRKEMFSEFTARVDRIEHKVDKKS